MLGVLLISLPCRIVPDKTAEVQALLPAKANYASKLRDVAQRAQAMTAADNEPDSPSNLHASQVQGQPSTIRTLPAQPAMSSAAPRPIIEPTKQADTVTLSFPAPSPRQAPKAAAIRPAITPLSLPHSRLPFRTTASSPLSVAGPGSLSMPPMMHSVPKAAGKFQVSATVSAGMVKAAAMPGQQSASKKTTGHGVTGLIPHLTSSHASASTGSVRSPGNGASSAAQAPNNLNAFPQTQPRPNSTSAGSFSSLPKQPPRTSSGGTRSSNLTPFGLTPLQGAKSGLPGLNSSISSLPAKPAAARLAGLCKSAASPALPFRLPLSSVQNTPKAVVPALPAVSPTPNIALTAFSPGLKATASISNEQGKNDVEEQQVPEAKGPASAPSPGISQRHVSPAPATHCRVGDDAVMTEAAESSIPRAKPWMSTSLAGGLMSNMKSLEAVSKTVLSL